MLLSQGDHCLALHRLLLNPRKFKFYMAQDSILIVLCLCTSCSELNKGCKHTNDSTQTWIALNSCQLTTVLHHGFFPDEHQLTNHRCGLDDLVQPLYSCKCAGGGLIIVSCPRDSVALDHPVLVNTHFGQYFSKVILHCCTCYVFVHG